MPHSFSRAQIHRDVKSENILIDANGYCLLGDMGLAAVCDADENQSLEVKGRSSMWYCAPIAKRENHLLNPIEGSIIRRNRFDPRPCIAAC